MAPLLLELSALEVEPLQTVEHAPCREGFYTPPGFCTVRSQENSLESITAASGDFEIDALLVGTFPVNDENCSGPQCCCCCCCPCCCCA